MGKSLYVGLLLVFISGPLLLFAGFKIVGLAEGIVTNKEIASLTKISSSMEVAVIEYLNGKRIATAGMASDSFIRSKVESITSLIKEAEEVNEETADAYEEEMLQLSSYIQSEKLPLDPDVLSILIFDREGNLLATTDGKAPIESVRDQLFLTRAAAATSLQDAVPYQENGATITIGTPIRIPNAGEGVESIGVLATIYDMDNIHKILSGERRIGLEEITVGDGDESPIRVYYLVNQNGDVLTRPQDMETFAPFAMNMEGKLPVKKCVNENVEISTMWQNLRGDLVLGTSQCMEVGDNVQWILIAEQDAAALESSLRPLKNITFATYILLGFIIVLIIFNFIRAILSNRHQPPTPPPTPGPTPPSADPPVAPPPANVPQAA